jgi:hypothetical protein
MDIRGPAVAATVTIAIVGVTACGSEKKSDMGRKTQGKPAVTAPGMPSKPEAEPNGVQKLPAKKIFDEAAKALDGAASLRIVAAMGGDTMDLAMDDRDNCQGTMAEDGARLELLQRGDDLYAKPDSAFYRERFEEKAPQVEKLVGGRHVKASSGDPQFGGGFVCDPDLLAGFLFSEHGLKGGQLTKKDTSEVNGARAIKLEGSVDGAPVTLSVALDGEPYLLKIECIQDGEPAVVEFRDYGRPLSHKAVPAPGDTVDAREIRKLTGATR